MPSKTPSGTDAGYRPNVGIVLVNRDGKIFVGRRNDMPDGAEWQMPQGGIDEGEAPAAAALRELRRRSAPTRPKSSRRAGSGSTTTCRRNRRRGVGGPLSRQRQKWFVMRYPGRDADITVDTEQPEFAAWKWVPVEQLPSMVVSFKRQVYVNLLSCPEARRATLGNAGRSDRPHDYGGGQHR